MRIAIRADASHQMGTGHVVRCLTLADELARLGARSTFLCRLIPEALEAALRAHGHDILHLPPSPPPSEPPGSPGHAGWLGASWQDDAAACVAALHEAPFAGLVVDHYAIDWRWHRALRRSASRILVIDDLADRRHDCDLLLDQGDLTGNGARYGGLVPKDCRLLLGPRYALLRREFDAWRGTESRGSKGVPRLFVCFGGSDPGNHTLTAIEALDHLSIPVEVDVVIGASHRDRGRIEGACLLRPSVRVHCQIDNMAEMMAGADLALGAGGSTNWERACLGLPSIVVAIERNQEEIAERMATAGLIRYLGAAGDGLGPRSIASAIEQCLENPSERHAMSRKGAALVDGHGAVRVAAHLLKPDPWPGRPMDQTPLPVIGLRRLEQTDLDRVRRWRNAPNVRQSMYNDHEIGEHEHAAWFARVSADPGFRAWIVEHRDVPIGFLSAGLHDERTATWASYLGEVEARGQGIGLFIAYQVLLFAFEHWNVEQVSCEVLDSNAVARQLYQRLGFMQNARLVGRAIKDDLPVDALRLTLTRRDWTMSRRDDVEERLRSRGMTPVPLLSPLEKKTVRRHPV